MKPLIKGPVMRDWKDYSAGDWFCLCMATGLGAGLAPIAPGTSGTLPGVAAHVMAAMWLPVLWQTPVLSLLLAVVCLIGLLTAPWAVRYWKREDPGRFVLDEVAGYLVVPVCFHHGRLWQVALWGFFIFRVFDIVKIPPAWQIDRRMHGPWGMLLDDLVSGVYTVAALYGLLWLSRSMNWGSWLMAG